jgi:2-polyprenyl-3-methyl-5-hydroxy-6-metoxy-1,4-benzoquinol methylase
MATTELLHELLPVLRCPFCSANELTETMTAARDEDIVTLGCGNCGHSTEFSDGIWHAMGPHHMNRTLAQFSNVAAPTAHLYERLWRVRSLSLLSGRSFPNDEELRELTAALKPTNDRIMLDVACSEGLYGRELARHGATVIAVDHSLPFLSRLTKRCQDEHLDRVLPVQAMAQHLPFTSSAFHGVAIGGSLNEIGDRQTALNEMARVAVSGAHVFSMHLLRAHTVAGRLLQTALGPSGITFGPLPETHQLFRCAALNVDDVKRDRVVVRISATKAPISSGTRTGGH